ncbi:regulatory protein YcgZ [Pantoea ananatis]|uniref:regulatory protein YcgZ n=1 Tax=Pantoea ananas TaxID=553 RepID=UPI0023B177C8|nr:regulatory protein YcgZ [Pantoea ananatis]
MRQNGHAPDNTSDIARYFSQANLPSQQETLGEIVVELLRAGQTLSRKAICSKLLNRLDGCDATEQQRHYQELIGLLFSRES